MNFGMPGGNENGLSLPIMTGHHSMSGGGGGGGGDQRDAYGCMSRPTYDTSPPLAIGAPGYLKPSVSPTSNGSSPPAHHPAAAVAYHHHPPPINGHHPHHHAHHHAHHQYNMNGSNSTGMYSDTCFIPVYIIVLKNFCSNGRTVCFLFSFVNVRKENHRRYRGWARYWYSYCFLNSRV